MAVWKFTKTFHNHSVVVHRHRSSQGVDGRRAGLPSPCPDTIPANVRNHHKSSPTHSFVSQRRLEERGMEGRGVVPHLNRRRPYLFGSCVFPHSQFTPLPACCHLPCLGGVKHAAGSTLSDHLGLRVETLGSGAIPDASTRVCFLSPPVSRVLC